VTFKTASKKVSVLRAELLAHTTFRRPKIDFDHPAGIAGGPWSYIQHYLAPEVLLRLDERQREAVYFIVTESHEMRAYAATEAGIEEWFADNAEQIAVQELSAALHVLERTSSQRLTGADLGDAHRAISVLRQKLQVPVEKRE